MNEHQAYLLVQIENLTEHDHLAAAEIAGQLAAQTTRRLSWWRRPRLFGRLPRPRQASEASHAV
jgi:hypothetical protein